MEQESRMAIPANKIREIQRLLTILRTQRISKGEALYILDELESVFRSIVEQREVRPEVRSYRELAEQLTSMVDTLIKLSRQPDNKAVVTGIATQALPLIEQEKVAILEDRLKVVRGVADRTKKILEMFRRRR